MFWWTQSELDRVVQKYLLKPVACKAFSDQKTKIMEQIALKWNDFEENVKSAFKVS